MTDESLLLSLLPDLNGGTFLQKADAALANVAASTIQFGEKGKRGKVILEFEMERLGESNQVRLSHGITIVQPTLRGKRSESDDTETPVHVGKGGNLTLMPDTQTRFEFDN